MTLKYYKIYTGRYGGELTVGTINEDFAEYWAPIVEEDGDSDLIATLHSYNWDDGDEDGVHKQSPAPADDFVMWECDDLEHLNGPFADNKYTVHEITLHADAEYVDGMLQWKEGVDHDYTVRMYDETEDEVGTFDYNALYSRECYSSYNNASEAAEVDGIPVLNFFSSEKGSFGEVIIETLEDFDPELLLVGQVETDLATIIEQYWYNRVALQVDFDGADSTGKGYYASVGFANPAWHDKPDQYISYDMSETAYVKEAFDDYLGVEEN